METFTLIESTDLITLSEAKLHLKIDYNADDPVISTCISFAQDYLQNETGRLVGEQTIEGYLDEWPSDKVIYLDDSPIIRVSTVKYLDAAGDEQTLSSSNYVFARGTRSRLVLKPDYTWPDLADLPQAVKVTYVGGWKRGANQSQGETEIPAELLKCMYLLVNHFYEHRELVYTGLQLREFPEDLTVKAVCRHHQRLTL